MGKHREIKRNVGNMETGNMGKYKHYGNIEYLGLLELLRL